LIDAEGIIYAGQLRRFNDEGPKPTALNTVHRVSDAGICERQRWFKAVKFDQSESPDMNTLLAFHMGTSIHEFVQEAFVTQAAVGGVTVDLEVPVDCRHLGVDLSGSADLVVTYKDGNKVVVEFKSASAYGYKLAREAPKREHVAQAGLYAQGLDAKGIVIVYIAKETSYRDKIRAGDVLQHEFLLSDEVFENETVEEVVAFELSRFKRVDKALKKNAVAVPIVFDEAGDAKGLSRLKTVEVAGPYGRPQKGAHWECRYCLFNSSCYGIGPDMVNL